ncbi:MAG: hypothetical protein CM15mP106_4340 [Candidatus Neomarinimicrobiota bacterium]|nr:MAG: hypothetical protein CM15mP106_4340 [Candidatus Neomarinimicrobiota bacterium]
MLFFMKSIGLSEDLLVSILHKYPYQILAAHTRLNESIVDMIVAIVPASSAEAPKEGLQMLILDM